MANRYREQHDPLTHAAIAVLAHDHFDLNGAQWQARRNTVMAAYPQVVGRADELWQESSRAVSADVHVDQRYGEGRRAGTLMVEATDGEGHLVSGVPYRVTLQGPAVFDDGSVTAAGESGDEPRQYAWHATGAGDVQVAVERGYPTLRQLVSNQDYVRFADTAYEPREGIHIAVRKDFAPVVTTHVERVSVKPGDPVIDVVTSGVADAESPWASGVELTAHGWYVEGIDIARAGATVAPHAGEQATDFLARLRERGVVPAAEATATFSGPGQTVQARAVTAQGKPYTAKANGTLGTWIWAFERERQNERARDYLTGDFVSAYLEPTETNVNASAVTVWSTVTDHSAIVGAELSDTIHVSGFPEDHGTFGGNAAIGLRADTRTATVSVWWAGDEHDPTATDTYRPSTEQVPQEDEHHRRIGTWEYPAVNGTLRVGGGVPDAHGNPVTITADKPGWYVFVWNFAGDDRVMPAASAYNDGWERTKVEPLPVVRPVSIVTQVSAPQVMVDEAFHDTARISGDLPEGAYVQFTAYRAIAYDADPAQAAHARNGEPAELLKEARVPLDHTLDQQQVSSPKVRSPQTGVVYWQASVMSAQGDVLATHALGVEGESVRVMMPEPQLAHTGSSVLPLIGIGVAGGLLGAGMLAVIRRRTLQ